MKSRRGGVLLVFVLGLAIGGLLGAVLMHKYLADQSARQAEDEATRPAAKAAPAQPSGDAAEDRLQRQLRDWHLTPEDLKRELAEAGAVIKREGSRFGERVKEASSDVRIIAMIKARYTLDRELSGWDIKVGSKDGHVTLSGTVTSPEQIGRAIAMALDTEGVVDVVSSLKVEQKG